MSRRAWSFAGAATLILFGVALAYLQTNNFWLYVLTKGAATFLAVAGLNLALGYTGLFSFAHISLYALGAYAAAIAVADHGLPVGAGFLIAAAVGMAGGWVLSLATFRARATHFAVVSLVLMFAVNQLLAGWDSVTHGEVGVTVQNARSPSPPGLFGLELGPKRYWLFGLLLMVLGAIVVRNLVRSPLGRGLVALRESEPAAASVGIDPIRYRMLALGAGGALAAVGGALFTFLDGYVSPDLAGFPPATLLVVSLLVGGAGTLWGPVLGVAFFIGIDRALIYAQNQFPTIDVVSYQQLITGVILFGIITFLPRGISGTAGWLLDRWPRKPKASVRSEPAPATSVLPTPRRTPVGGVVLECRGLSKAFGGVKAVDELDLRLDWGAIHGLIGPNGSGKTTIVNLITGVIEFDRGQIRFLDDRVDHPRPSRMAALGVGRVFQRAEILARVTALENVLTGFHLVAERGVARNVLRLPKARRREKELRREAMSLLSFFELEDRADVHASALPYGDRRLLEVARAMAARPTLLVLDEPATGLSAGELDRLTAVLRRLREAGVTVLLIEHNMEFLMELCDRVTVLDYGRKIAEGTPGEVQQDPRVLEAYLGARAGKAELGS